MPAPPELPPEKRTPELPDTTPPTLSVFPLVAPNMVNTPVLLVIEEFMVDVAVPETIPAIPMLPLVEIVIGALEAIVAPPRRLTLVTSAAAAFVPPIFTAELVPPVIDPMVSPPFRNGDIFNVTLLPSVMPPVNVLAVLLLVVRVYPVTLKAKEATV